MILPARLAPRASAPIEDYALLGNGETAALVSKAGAIDWLCWPRFDSPACFAALLGTPAQGRWWIGPSVSDAKIVRGYRADTMVLETEFTTDTGRAALIDFMVPGSPSVVRIAEGREGAVAMRQEFTPRFGYGAEAPTITQKGNELHAVSGSEQMVLRSVGPAADEFTVRTGERLAFVLSYAPSDMPRPVPPDSDTALAATEAFWSAWSAQCTYRGPWRDIVLRSLLTLKALCHAGTGGIVAAPTTSLPERIGGERNWDYRFCWPRDSSLTAGALLRAGFQDEARAWGAWLVRAAAGGLRTVYRLDRDAQTGERTLPWLPGYRDSAPVRVGNAAGDQVQLDIYGEVLDAVSHLLGSGSMPAEDGRSLVTGLMDQVEATWQQPDEGIWEVRGGRQHFTYSKVMAWVAVDRALRCATTLGPNAPMSRWRALRTRIHANVCSHGFSAARNSFTQTYGGTEVDASLLLLPAVGFLPASDPRIAGTIAAIERDLMVDGLLLRYRGADGLPPGEGVFLACGFWYADALILSGRRAEAEAVFARLVGLANDVGLLSEEYDPRNHRMLGNFPQAFSHLALVNTALNLETPAG